jgi:spoIIIJ-associated protein
METSPPTTTTTTTAPATTGTPLDPREALQTMLDGLGLETKVESHLLDGNTLLQITTPEPGRLIGRHGQTLSQLQFLLNRVLQRASAAAPRVTVDCEHYRERQHDEVLQSVRTAADRVVRWGEPVVIGPFNAFDRRVIHQYFTTHQEIEAVSDELDQSGMKKMTLRLKPVTK